MHSDAGARTSGAPDQACLDLSYFRGPFVVSVGYAYATAEKGNGLNATFTDGQD